MCAYHDDDLLLFFIYQVFSTLLLLLQPCFCPESVCMKRHNNDIYCATIDIGSILTKATAKQLAFW